jgi:phosphatidylinositol alpha 1,6-mannosyltransferase
VDVGQFGPAARAEELRRSWTGGREDQVVVGYVGRLAAEKELWRLSQIADLPGVTLVVVGDGPERARLQRRLPAAVFTGMLGGDELATAFASLDVFVHTGTAETFCQTVQEAQASGVAVMAPAMGGPLDLVDDGRTGVLFDPADPSALRRATTVLVADPMRRRRLARAALAEVRGRTWARVVDELTDIHYPAVMSRTANRFAA